MLAKLIYQFYQWNPFNLYGIEVEVEDLINCPLCSTETLRQDKYGSCRRIKAPSLDSSLWERWIFWLQVHLNEKGHLEAIDKLISLFYEKLLQNPPQLTQRFQEFKYQLNQLRCLKNDYGFVSLHQGDPSWVEYRLSEIEKSAYSIFEYYHKKQVSEQEEDRKKTFEFFQQHMDRKLEELAVEYLLGLEKVRLFTVAPYDVLPALFEERIKSLQERLKEIEALKDQIDEMERMHEGKFTIPFIKDYLKRMRLKLYHEIQKIGFETKLLIMNLIINYQITPFKDRVKVFLDIFQIDPEDKLSA